MLRSELANAVAGGITVCAAANLRVFYFLKCGGTISIFAAAEFANSFHPTVIVINRVNVPITIMCIIDRLLHISSCRE